MAKSIRKSTGNIWGFSTESLLLRQTRIERQSQMRVAKVRVDASKKASKPQRILDRGEGGIEVHLSPLSANENETNKRLQTPPLVRLRDGVGQALAAIEKCDADFVEFDFQLDREQLNAALLGLEIGLYRFKRCRNGEPMKMGFLLRTKGKIVPLATIEQATIAGRAVNLARHLINLPPNQLNPVTYALAVKDLLAEFSSVKTEIWDEKQLAKERMNLHLGVGQGSPTPPRLVHIRYRPTGSSRQTPVALVGKGITFDSGGLDIKPSSGMRLMKKDMGGSAAVLAVMWWAAATKQKVALDGYLALAENAVDGASFRPSDVLIARNGQSIEIHNTDAEGRLVLADAMDVAITQKETPRILIDVATLTGAIKVALGANLAGLFSSDARLSDQLENSGRATGDWMWPMPLVQRYRAQMNSNFADQVNAADGFGGAITAALFLEKFAGEVPWAHLDIYAWKDSSEGPWLEAGGSGQSVLALAHWLSHHV